MAKKLTHAQRVAAAVELLAGLELTSRDCCMLMTAPTSVPEAWMPAHAADVRQVFDDHKHMWPDARLKLGNSADMGRTLGYCETGKRRTLTICVACDVPYTTALETLVHELAHASAWDIDHDHDHGVHWGIEYARAYGAIMGDHS